MRTESLSSWELKQMQPNTWPRLDISSLRELSLTPFKMSQRCDPRWTCEWARMRGKLICFASPNSLSRLWWMWIMHNLRSVLTNWCMIDWIILYIRWKLATLEVLPKPQRSFSAHLSFWSAPAFLHQLLVPNTCSCPRCLMLSLVQASTLPCGSEHASGTIARWMNIHKWTCRLAMIHRLIRDGKSLITCCEVG